MNHHETYLSAQQHYQAGRWPEAESHCRQLLTEQPAHTGALHLLGLLAQQARNDEQASHWLSRAIRQDPRQPEYYNLLGNSLRRLDQWEPAAACFRQALKLAPDQPAIWCNLGNLQRDLGQWEKAEECYQIALQHDPDHAPAHWNRALTFLLQGRLREGWKEYEWRWKVGGQFSSLPAHSSPLWWGEPLNGRTILLQEEQGFGDTIQFIRYASGIQERGGRVLLQCRPTLAALMRTVPGVAEVWLEEAQAPGQQIDTHVSLLSLPSLFQTELDTIPAKVPYLSAPAPVPALPALARPAIGLVWAGSKLHVEDRRRSIRFEHLAPLLKIPGPSFVSLQTDAAAAELAHHPERQPLIDLGSALKNFSQTASYLNQLDLVITVDTAVAHLAGALGKPAWVLLPFVPDWRWLLNRSDSPWYPSLRLFRQPAPGDWASVLAEVERELRVLLANQTPRCEVIRTSPPRLDEPPNHGPVKSMPSTGLGINVNELLQRGVAARQQQSLDEARHWFEAAVEHYPDHFASWYNLALLRQETGDLAGAVAGYRRALAILPTAAAAWENLGVALKESQHSDEALTCLEKARQLNPGFASIYNNLALVRRARGELISAEQCSRSALRLKPQCPEYLTNLGNILRDLGRPYDAIKAYEQALQIAPQLAEAHWNLGFVKLLTGDWPRGWVEYEWRWRRREFAKANRRAWTLPLWQGEPIAGKTLWVHAEQGCGDTIQFCRYGLQLALAGARVILECQPSLMSLLESLPCFLDRTHPVSHNTPVKPGLLQVVSRGALSPRGDFRVPLLSLPGRLETTPEHIPGPVPYLAAGSKPGFPAVSAPKGARKVGLVWSGNPQFANQKNRSVPLPVFSRLLRLPENHFRFFSLQVGAAATDISLLAEKERLMDLSSLLQDFADTAAMIDQLDLVITVDTAVAHLAGALGKPVWTLLPFAPDWRWLLHRSDTPWYPTMRLFRQETPGDWEGVVARLAADLRAWSSPKENRQPALAQLATP